jgi:hypothetical protein
LSVAATAQTRSFPSTTSSAELKGHRLLYCHQLILGRPGAPTTGYRGKRKWRKSLRCFTWINNPRGTLQANLLYYIFWALEDARRKSGVIEAREGNRDQVQALSASSIVLTLPRDSQLAVLSWIDYHPTGLIVFGHRPSALIPDPESRGREDSGTLLGWCRFLQTASVLTSGEL